VAAHETRDESRYDAGWWATVEVGQLKAVSTAGGTAGALPALMTR
jgi:hypothetical protein